AKSGRFDAAVSAYIAAVQKDPAAALSHKPALPAGNSTFLETAAGQIDSALNRTTWTDAQKQALLLLQLDILQARKDNAKAIEVMKKLAALKAPATTGPDAGKLLADVKLSSAHIFLQKGDYPKAISEIESAKSSYTE